MEKKNLNYVVQTLSPPCQNCRTCKAICERKHKPKKKKAIQGPINKQSEVIPNVIICPKRLQLKKLNMLKLTAEYIAS